MGKSYEEAITTNNASPATPMSKRDESGMGRNESAAVWDESAARAAAYPSRLNDFAT